MYLYSVAQVADMLGVSKETLRRWDNSGKLRSTRHPMNNYRFYSKDQLKQFEELHFIFDDSERPLIKPLANYKTIELFAGAGGLAIGLEKAGLETVLLNEIDKAACETLRTNRPQWNVQQGDVGQLDFTPYANQVDLITGGFPCQAFSYAGKKMGFEDARGTLFFEFARAVKTVNPKVFMAENVRGLLNHDKGRTLENIRSVIDELGYTLLEPRLMKAIFYRVPQKRERCHPEETRPFTVREYARIQTFPDDWQFQGALTSQYKQIGNAVPVNMAYELGLALVDFLNQLHSGYRSAPHTQHSVANATATEAPPQYTLPLAS